MLVCPQCGSRNLRYSRIRNFSERAWSWFGIRPLRCRDCRLRFLERTWRLLNLRYARCPLCWRMDLARWSEQDYYVPLLKKVLLRIGGRPYRCAYCRVNFVSFRPRLERYRSRHHSRERADAQASGAANGGN